MSGRIEDRNIWLINGTILLVGVAYGIAISILAVFLDANGYTKGDIGKLAAWFALGIVSMSIPMGSLIRRTSARTTLIGSIGLYALAVAVFPFVIDHFWLAALVRFVDGGASVGIWVSCETIVLSRAQPTHKAYVTTLYAICLSIGYVVGPFLAGVLVAAMPFSYAFVGAGALSVLTALLVLMRLDRDPPNLSARGSDEPPPTSPYPNITWRIKTACMASFSYSYFQSSVVLFLPLYLIAAKGIDRELTILIPGFFALGMLLFTNIAGRLGDRYGHLLLMRVLGVVGSITVLGFVFLDQYWLMCVAVFMAGATLAAISPISLALQGMIVEPQDYRRSNAVYNTFYGAGMLFGPPVSSVIMSYCGGAAMLYHLAAMWGVFVLLSIIFARDDPAHGKAAGIDRAPESAA